MKKDFTLKEIAKWQLDSTESNVELPDLQRGFVWKPKQIEDVWDSILRGYPIGSFLFSKSCNKFNLLDGQQRATAIFLGHYNPFENPNSIKAWSIKTQLPVIWIDIAPAYKTKLSLYTFRVVTNSHPWGYQIQNNDLRLTESDRRNAIAIFRKNPENEKIGYTKFENTTVFPYDSSYPIPLSFFLEADNTTDIIKMVEKYLPDYIETKRGDFDNKEQFVQKLQTDLIDNLDSILNQINKTKSIEIHANIVNEEVIQQENSEENPTLFQRINSSGTTLSGDDLIYSIYKTIFQGTKQIVENISLNFIPPTQVISLITRFAVSNLEDHRYSKKLNIREFQNKIKEEIFKNKLEELLNSDQLKKTVNLALNILSCTDVKEYGEEIPPVVIKSLVKKNQDLFLFLVYWLYINKVDLTDRIKLKIAGKIYLFHLFNFTNIQTLWNEEIKNQNFWNEPVNRYIWWNENDGINFIIPPNFLEDFYKNPKVLESFKTNNPERWKLIYSDNIKGYFAKIKGIIDTDTANKYFESFIENLKNSRLLILLAQRKYINDNFKDFNQLEDFEDTNTPWDWDHIYPTEWVYNKSNINKGIRDWNNTIGNFRALSLDTNRKEGNKISPKIRLESQTNKNESFVSNSDYIYWEKIEERIYGDYIENHFYAITTRMINIYKTFWNDFKIDEFIEE